MPPLNSDKIILDLCGGTGAWSKPYKDAGYDVCLITLPENDVRDWNNTHKQIYKMLWNKPIYGILAAPPCTQFSIARTTAFTPRDLRGGIEIVKACVEIIWEARINNKLAFWALENPFGLLRQFLGKPAFTFHPYDFGHPYTKRTELWGYFKEPSKNPIEVPNRIKMQLAKNNRILPLLPEGYKEPGKRNQAARRAITPAGFAKAFFEANQ